MASLEWPFAANKMQSCYEVSHILLGIKYLPVVALPGHDARSFFSDFCRFARLHALTLPVSFSI